LVLDDVLLRREGFFDAFFFFVVVVGVQRQLQLLSFGGEYLSFGPVFRKSLFVSLTGSMPFAKGFVSTRDTCAITPPFPRL
jgi:hypothetical protein